MSRKAADAPEEPFWRVCWLTSQGLQQAVFTGSPIARAFAREQDRTPGVQAVWIEEARVVWRREKEGESDG